MPTSIARAGAFMSTANNPALVRAQSDAGSKTKLLRRHSSGDHAFLPDKTHKDALKESKKNFGVPGNLVQDAEGDRLPTTRGY